MSQVKQKVYYCKVCGEKDSNSFYVSKGRSKCKSCIIKEKRKVIKDKENVSESPEELASRLESLNTLEMDMYPSEIGITWREKVNNSVKIVEVVESNLDVLNQEFSNMRSILIKLVENEKRFVTENKSLITKVSNLEETNKSLITKVNDLEEANVKSETNVTKEIKEIKKFCWNLYDLLNEKK